LWIFIPAVIGEHVGAGLGAIFGVQAVGELWGRDSAILAGLLHGAITGAVLGAIIGAIVWAFFPYKRNP
jgi:hypothetical protein